MTATLWLAGWLFGAGNSCLCCRQATRNLNYRHMVFYAKRTELNLLGSGLGLGSGERQEQFIMNYSNVYFAFSAMNKYARISALMVFNM